MTKLQNSPCWSSPPHISSCLFMIYTNARRALSFIMALKASSFCCERPHFFRILPFGKHLIPVISIRMGFLPSKQPILRSSKNIFIYLCGWNGHLLAYRTCPRRQMAKNAKQLEKRMRGRGNRSTQRKSAPVPLCPPQIRQDLTRDRTRWLTPELRHDLSERYNCIFFPRIVEVCLAVTIYFIPVPVHYPNLTATRQKYFA
jgi:hypothetical protein